MLYFNNNNTIYMLNNTIVELFNIVLNGIQKRKVSNEKKKNPSQRRFLKSLFKWVNAANVTNHVEFFFNNRHWNKKEISIFKNHCLKKNHFGSLWDLKIVSAILRHKRLNSHIYHRK